MFESKINRGRANGYAPLDSGSKIPLSHLPPLAPVINTGSLVAEINSLSASISNISFSNTGSFATTGSNTFIGNQTIQGGVTSSGFTIVDAGIPHLYSSTDLKISANTINFSGSLSLSGTSGTAGAAFTIGQFANTSPNSFDVRASGSYGAGVSVTSDSYSIFGVTDTPSVPSNNSSFFGNEIVGYPFSDGPIAAIGILKDGATQNDWIFNYDGKSFLPSDVTIGFNNTSTVTSGSLNITKGNINVSGSIFVSGNIYANNLTGSKFDTGSFATTSSLQLLINSTGSFATTGSNTFVGTQTISGSFTLGTNDEDGTTYDTISVPSGHNIWINPDTALAMVGGTNVRMIVDDGNNNLYISTSDEGLTNGVPSAGGFNWKFEGSTNSLILPVGGTIKEDSSPAGLGNTITLTPHGGSDANQQLKIYPTVSEGNHLHLTSGDLSVTSLFLGNDSQYVRTNTNGEIVIGTNDIIPDAYSTGKRWKFDKSGSLTIPSEGNIVVDKIGPYSIIDGNSAGGGLPAVYYISSPLPLDRLIGVGNKVYDSFNLSSYATILYPGVTSNGDGTYNVYYDSFGTSPSSLSFGEGGIWNFGINDTLTTPGGIDVNGSMVISGSVNISSSLIVSSTIVNNGTIDTINTDLIIESGDLTITGSINQTGTFYADQIDVSYGTMVQTTGSYVMTRSGSVVTYDSYDNIAEELKPLLSTTTSTGPLSPWGTNVPQTGSYESYNFMFDPYNSGAPSMIASGNNSNGYPDYLTIWGVERCTNSAGVDYSSQGPTSIVNTGGYYGLCSPLGPGDCAIVRIQDLTNNRIYRATFYGSYNSADEGNEGSYGSITVERLL